jgi:hypothetical protein
VLEKVALVIATGICVVKEILFLIYKGNYYQLSRFPKILTNYYTPEIVSRQCTRYNMWFENLIFFYGSYRVEDLRRILFVQRMVVVVVVVVLIIIIIIEASGTVVVAMLCKLLGKMSTPSAGERLASL